MSKSLEIKNNKIRRRKVSWSKKGPTFVRTIVIPNTTTKSIRRAGSRWANYVNEAWILDRNDKYRTRGDKSIGLKMILYDLDKTDMKK